MSFGLFASDSQTVVTNTTNNLTNSNNVTNSSSHVVSESGNITLNLGNEELLDKALPIILVVGIVLIILGSGGKLLRSS